MSNNQNQGASIEAERALFEAWAKNEYENLGGEYAGPGKTGWYYWDDETAAAFDGWLASAAARRTPAAPAGAGELPTSAALDNALQRLVTAWQPAIASPNVVQERVAARSEVMRMFADLRAQLAAAQQVGKHLFDAVATPPEQQARAVPDVAQVGEQSDDDRDPLYDRAVQIVRAHRRASLSLVQRLLCIGYNRSARLFEAMEKASVVSPVQMNGHRTVLPVEQGQPSAKGGDVDAGGAA